MKFFDFFGFFWNFLNSFMFLLDSFGILWNLWVGLVLEQLEFFGILCNSLESFGQSSA